MDEIANEPLLQSKEDSKKINKNKNIKKILLMGICVTVGLLIGVMIGYFSFRQKDKSTKSNQILNKYSIINSSLSNYSIKPQSIEWVELLPQIVEVTAKLGVEIIDFLSSPSVSYSQPKGNDHWFTCSNGRWGSYKGMVLSMYYHKYRRHSATTVGKLGPKRSIAKAGSWAISYQTRKIRGNEAYYNDQL